MGDIHVYEGQVSNGIILNSDNMYVHWSGLANYTVVEDVGKLFILSGGVASSTVVSNGGTVLVSVGGKANSSNGGVASKTIVGSDGKLYASDGGVACETTVNKGGSIVIYDGGVASNATINAGASALVENGGMFSSAVLLGGTLTISSGGVVSSGGMLGGVIRVGSEGKISGGKIQVGSGGKISGGYVISVGTMYVSGGAFADGVVLSGGIVYVSSGGNLTQGFVYSAGSIHVSSRGRLDSVTVSGGASLTIDNRGNGTNIVENGGFVGLDPDVATSSFKKNTFGNSTISWGATLHSGTTAYAVSVTTNGSIFVYSSGLFSSGAVISGGHLHLSGGGIVSSVRVTSSSYMHVFGGSVNATTVTGSSYIDVSGGSANAITVTGSSYMDVFDGTVNATTVTGSATLRVDGNGTANRTTVGADGAMIVVGGTANSTTVYSNGWFYLSSAGVAESTVVSSHGRLYVSGGGFANLTTVSNFGRLYVFSGGSVDSTTINSSGRAYVSNGGVANSVAIGSGGWLQVGNGGSATALSVDGGGSLTVESGGSVDLVQVTGKGEVQIGNGGELSATTVGSGGGIGVRSGGTATGTIVEDDGYIQISGGGTATGTVLTGSGSMHIYSDGVANSTTVNGSGRVFVYSGGVANDTVVNSDGHMYVFSSGVANGVTVNSWGHLYVEGNVYDVDIVSGGRLGCFNLNEDRHFDAIENGQVDIANKVTINGSRMFVSNGGAVNSIYVFSKGYLHISGGGVANAVIVKSEGNMHLSSGGVASDVTVNYGGSMYVHAGAQVSDVMEKGGYVNIADGADATFVSNTFNYVELIDRSATVHSGTTANSTVVSSGGGLYIYSGGIANSTTVKESGRIYIYSGGIISGTLDLSAGALVSAYEGSIIELDISTLKPQNPALISDISLVHGTPDYNVTVSKTQTEGIYSLAGGAVGFNRTITVSTAAGEEIGTITVGGEELISPDYAYAYRLGITEGVLSLTVTLRDITPPETPIASADTKPTTGNVTVTATFSEDSDQKQYSLDGETWQEYTDDGVVMTDNGTVYFRAADEAGNVSEVAEYEVTNIDREPPVAPTATADTTPTNQSVTVTATFSDDSVGKQYYIGNTAPDEDTTWQEYTDGVVMTDNGTVYFRGTDAAGNVSDIAKYEVSNIDREPPVAPTATADTTPTNQNVIVRATFSDDSVNRRYSTDNKLWLAYDEMAGVVMSDNGSVYFRGTDAAGNDSKVTEYEVTNIDREPPVAPTATADVTTPTNQNVTVTATFSSDTTEREYSLDNQTWTPYTTGVEMTDNGTVYFRATDAAGNVSDVTAYEVANIDRTDPAKPVAYADITSPTNQNVTVSATFADDSVEKQYSLDNSTWKDYTSGIVLSQNGKVYFRSINSAGNASGVTEYEVANIDKIAPEAPVAAADITSPTNQSVTVSATYSDDTAVKQYSFNDTTWNVYTTGVVMTDNGTVSFRGIDAVGNVSDATKYTVSNIDRIAPDKPTAAADITTKTNKNVTVTATFSSDSVQKQYSLDGKTWKTYTTGVVFTENGTIHFRGIDAVGNISEVTDFTVGNIVDDELFFSDLIVPGQPYYKSFTAEVEAAGWYTMTAESLGTINGTVTIMDGNRKVASGTIKNGELEFNKNQSVLLETGKKYTVIVTSSDNANTSSPYSLTLNAVELFVNGDNSDDTATTAKTIAANTYDNNWVGYGDAMDYYILGVNENGGFYDLNLSGVQNKVKLTVYSAQAKKIKSVSASAKNPNVALENLCLTKGSYAVVEAPKAAKAQNSNYTLWFAEKATFTGTKNNDWSQAEVLTPDASFSGTLSKAAGGDNVDYCDISAFGNLFFDMREGKAKVSFYDANKNKVKIATVTMADSSIRKEVSSLTLTADSLKTDNFAIGTLPDNVKYLKIEASTRKINSYTINKIA